MSKEYVEREVISEGIRKYYYKNPPNSSYEEGFDRGLDKAQRVILNAPAADVAQVVHGRWIDKGWDGDINWQIDGRGSCWRVHECSECKAQQKMETTSYCPNCGAKMDKEEACQNGGN